MNPYQIVALAFTVWGIVYASIYVAWGLHKILKDENQQCKKAT